MSFQGINPVDTTHLNNQFKPKGNPSASFAAAFDAMAPAAHAAAGAIPGVGGLVTQSAIATAATATSPGIAGHSASMQMPTGSLPGYGATGGMTPYSGSMGGSAGFGGQIASAQNSQAELLSLQMEMNNFQLTATAMTNIEAARAKSHQKAADNIR